MTKLAGNQRIPFQYKKGPDNKVAHALSRVGHNLIFLWFPLTYKIKSLDTRSCEFLCGGCHSTEMAH